MPFCVRRELLREELQFCCSTGAFSCSDALNHLTASCPTVDRGLDSPVIPNVRTSLSTRRMDTPSR